MKKHESHPSVKSSFLFTSLFLCATSLSAHAKSNSVPVFAARAEMMNAQGHTQGVVGLSEGKDGVVLHVTIEGLKPGTYGIHFHENGVCEGKDDFKSAGGHFNPENHEHGLENTKGPHVGDLPNLKIVHEGKSEIELVSPRVTLQTGKNSLFQPKGTSIVIHEKQDDQKSNPAGDSGKRIYCGVIKKAELDKPIAPVAKK